MQDNQTSKTNSKEDAQYRINCAETVQQDEACFKYHEAKHNNKT
jgi:hypothetical protein